jgi:tetratricopeptide (TPR) repeat protein
VVSDEGANLVLAAALSHTESMVTLTLQVLEAETSHILRRKQTTVTGGAISVLAEKASALAAELLDLPRDVSLSDPDELDQASASTFRLYSEAKALVEQPNDTGLDAGILKYQQLVNDNPHFALGYAQLSLAYTRQYILHHVAGSLDMANSNADLALEYNPRSALALRSKALALLYSGRTNEALDKLDTALQVDPENPETLLYKAQALEYLNRGKDAVTVFDKILKNRPNYWPAHNEFGLLLFRQARYKDAAKAFEDASVIAPQVALPLANLGTMYLTMGDTQMAADALNRSLRRAPNYIAYLSLGDMAFIAGDYSKALTNYTRARDLKPASDIPWRDLGDTYAMLKRPAQVRESYANAARLLSAALKDNPNDGVNWMTMAFYRAKVGDAAEARESLRQAKAYGATDVESQLTEAQVLALLGEKEEAIQLVLDCLKKGISPSEINLALDLKDVRLDPRYKAAVARARS